MISAKKTLSFAVLALLISSIMAFVSDAFSVAPASKTREAIRSSSAMGYTMQMPQLPKSTWYDVANPTARRIIYDDGPSEFIFAAVGNNWPELNDVPDEEERMPEPTPNKARQTLARINPIRRARNLIRQVL